MNPSEAPRPNQQPGPEGGMPQQGEAQLNLVTLPADTLDRLQTGLETEGGKALSQEDLALLGQDDRFNALVGGHVMEPMKDALAARGDSSSATFDKMFSGEVSERGYLLNAKSEETPFRVDEMAREVITPEAHEEALTKAAKDFVAERQAEKQQEADMAGWDSLADAPTGNTAETSTPKEDWRKKGRGKVRGSGHKRATRSSGPDTETASKTAAEAPDAPVADEIVEAELVGEPSPEPVAQPPVAVADAPLKVKSERGKGVVDANADHEATATAEKDRYFENGEITIELLDATDAYLLSHRTASRDHMREDLGLSQEQAEEVWKQYEDQGIIKAHPGDKLKTNWMAEAERDAAEYAAKLEALPGKTYSKNEIAYRVQLFMQHRQEMESRADNARRNYIREQGMDPTLQRPGDTHHIARDRLNLFRESVDTAALVDDEGKPLEGTELYDGVQDARDELVVQLHRSQQRADYYKERKKYEKYVSSGNARNAHGRRPDWKPMGPVAKFTHDLFLPEYHRDAYYTDEHWGRIQRRLLKDWEKANMPQFIRDEERAKKEQEAQKRKQEAGPANADQQGARRAGAARRLSRAIFGRRR